MRLIFTGDILPADRQHTLGIGLGSKFAKYQQKNWMPVLSDYDPVNDILFGNLEAPLLNEVAMEEGNKKAFAGNANFAKWLQLSGYDIVSVANNHILEHGENGFQSTVHALEKENVKPVGIKNETTGSNLVRINKQDITVGFASFNAVHDITPNEFYAELNEDAVFKAIGGLKKNTVNMICLSFHWGNEYIHIPPWEQVQLARKAIDAGADIIIGHHPHVVQPIEEYKHGIIIYSLGNFLFDMLWSKEVRCGMSVEVELDKAGIQSCKAKLVDIQNDYTPVIIEDDDWLNTLLHENLGLMNRLLEQGKNVYEKHYFKKLKRNRFKARLGMKKQLIQQWPLLPKPVRKQIIRNIFSKFTSS